MDLFRVTYYVLCEDPGDNFEKEELVISTQLEHLINLDELGEINLIEYYEEEE